MAQNMPRYNAAAEREANYIGRIIAEERQSRGLSLAAFSTLLARYGVDISAAGINKWELGKSVPGAYQLMALAFALGREEDMSFFASCTAELNAEGRRKLHAYKEDLAASGRYRAVPAGDKIKYITMPVSFLPVSAGPGAFLDDDMFEQVRFPESAVPRGADFGLRVRGDSMEPVYHDEQIVWVSRCDRVQPGQVGIFVYEGCGYIKEYALREPEDERDFTDSLGNVQPQSVMISYNEKYAPIPIPADADFRVVGRVLR